MKERKSWLSIIYVIIGIVLIGFGCFEIVDEFWSGMGSALMVIGVLRLVRSYRFSKNEAYRERIEIEEKDERNHFIRNKAWAWAGYLFVMIMAVLTIVFKLIGQEILMMAASSSVCLVLTLFWVAYLVLKRKY